jgi:hypothetical protein
MAMASIAVYDWPENWPDLLPFLLKLISDQTNMNGGESLIHSCSTQPDDLFFFFFFFSPFSFFVYGSCILYSFTIWHGTLSLFFTLLKIFQLNGIKKV